MMKRIVYAMLLCAAALSIASIAAAQSTPTPVTRMGDFIEISDDVFMNLIFTTQWSYVTSTNNDFEDDIQDRTSSNANASTTGVELYIVPSGGSASTTTRTTLKSFSANETYTAPELIGQSIETGGTIQGNDGGNGGTGVNFTLTVTEFTGDS